MDPATPTITIDRDGIKVTLPATDPVAAARLAAEAWGAARKGISEPEYHVEHGVWVPGSPPAP